MNKLLGILAVLLISLNAHGQITYLDINYNEVKDQSLATYKMEITMTDSIAGIKKICSIDGKPRSEESFSNLKKMTLSGVSKYWFNSGQLKEAVSYKENQLDGEVTTYYKNGQLKRKDVYKIDSLIEGRCYDSLGVEKAHTLFHKRPQFPGGIYSLTSYLQRNLKYPSSSRKKGIEGKVMVRFTINPTGLITGAYIKQGINNELDNEALRVVNSLPNWEPGIHDGEYVNFQFVLPVIYKLN
ncbi:hypothetical protein C3K47_04585 [Solitalea longa]|uniref:TonB C-terminal domain-containing protein n=1 Tax=Solitalea longa TaxID=2079460 RepID=A0A2S5A5M1_9SPHI|nr:energy transducer TonB [Solitalea longa]POY37814.1 hypothetical protein C3K47_04585 [Solitalea longa]